MEETPQWGQVTRNTFWEERGFRPTAEGTRGWVMVTGGACSSWHQIRVTVSSLDDAASGLCPHHPLQQPV